jgi:hypothetical protein
MTTVIPVSSSKAALHESSSSSSLGTYEATMAALSAAQQPDPIHWVGQAAFRESRYRQLHHQCGVSGIFTVRLLQARNLRRSHWSPLALGPVKLLGWSKAHGAVSSFCEFSLDFGTNREEEEQLERRALRALHHQYSQSSSRLQPGGGDRKPAAKSKQESSKTKKTLIVSPVIPHNDHPVWGDTCHFEFPLKKGAAPADGMRILLTVHVREEATAVEQILPRDHHHGDDNTHHRLLGRGQLDLTDLCLGDDAISGQALPGVMDAWIDLTLPRREDVDDDFGMDLRMGNSSSDDSKPAASLLSDDSTNSKAAAANDPLSKKPKSTSSQDDTTNSSYGQVRVLVSYQPVGLDPQPKDIVALESVARQNRHTASCRSVVDPLMPFTVLDRRGSYVLAEYMLQDAAHTKVCVRLHRNAVFVIERQTIIDAATNLALLPVDVALSTPLGHAVQQALTPLVHAGGELLMPALLSAKLVWMAARTTGLGVASGIFALTGTLWREGATSLSQPSVDGRNHRRAVERRGSATAQFVQL